MHICILKVSRYTRVSLVGVIITPAFNKQRTYDKRPLLFMLYNYFSLLSTTAWLLTIIILSTYKLHARPSSCVERILKSYFTRDVQCARETACMYSNHNIIVIIIITLSRQEPRGAHCALESPVCTRNNHAFIYVYEIYIPDNIIYKYKK
jgi:hypothetical protein